MEKDKKKTTTKKKTETTKNEELKTIIEEKVKEQWNNLYESNIQKYVKDSINNELIEQFEKANKKVIKEKNKKILWKNIVIVILIGIIGFLLYLLYDNGYFNPMIKQSTTTTKEEQKEEEKEPSLEELKEEYGHLIDSITISENSSYLEDFYQGNITKELKNYIVLNTMDFSKLEVEDDYNIIDEKTLKEQYEKIWNDSYHSTSFQYNNQKIRYVNKIESYITEKQLEKESSNIIREIIDIKVYKDIIKITTIEGLKEEDTIKNILTKEEIGEDESIVDHQEELNKITYVFSNKKLETITK